MNEKKTGFLNTHGRMRKMDDDDDYIYYKRKFKISSVVQVLVGFVIEKLSETSVMKMNTLKMVSG